MTERKITLEEAINEAIDISMQQDHLVFIIGEGVPDPKAIFGTTKNLREKYGAKRVMDMPISENGLTGVCIGAAIMGLKPIITHQRIDFSLYAMDQIVNNAAKWHYLFNGEVKVPLVIRLIIGRGWGQGVQHSQNLQALFSHVPGLKVVMPSTPHDAKGLLISSIEDNNPVIYIEHRWLHNLRDYVPEGRYTVPIGKCNAIKEGADITIASTSYMTMESLRATEMLNQLGVYPEIIDIRTLKPLDEATIISSVRKTSRLLVADLGWRAGGFAAEVVSTVVEKAFGSLKSAPQRVTSPDFPAPATPALANYYYPLSTDLGHKVLEMLGKPKKYFDRLSDLGKKYTQISLDQPDPLFTGPF